MNQNLDRGLPASNDAERSILGAILIDAEALSQATPELESGAFALKSHRRIYAHMVKMAGAGRAIDVVTLCDELGAELQSVGGVAYITELMDGVPRRPSISEYVRIVKDKAALRNLIESCHEISRRATDQADPAEAILEDAAQAMDALRKRCLQKKVRWEDLPETLSKQSVKYIVDELLQECSVTLLTGPSNVGKSVFALRMLSAIALGTPFLGATTMRRPALYIDHENCEDTQGQRQDKMTRGPVPGLRWWASWDPRFDVPLTGNTDLLEIAADIRPVVLIDTLIRFLPSGADENSASDTRVTHAYLRKLTAAGATVIVIHHHGKTLGGKSRGSSDIVAGADAAWSLEPTDGDSNVLKLERFKSRVGPTNLIWTIRHNTDNHSFERTEDPIVTKKTDDVERVAKIIREFPGITTRKLLRRAESQISWKSAHKLLIAKEGELWDASPGPNNSKLYHLLDSGVAVLRSKERYNTTTHNTEPLL